MQATFRPLWTFLAILLKSWYSGAVAGGGVRGGHGPPIVETRRKIVNVVGNCRKIDNVVGNCQSVDGGGWRFKMLSSGKIFGLSEKIFGLSEKYCPCRPPPPPPKYGSHGATVLILNLFANFVETQFACRSLSRVKITVAQWSKCPLNLETKFYWEKIGVRIGRILFLLFLWTCSSNLPMRPWLHGGGGGEGGVLRSFS